LFANWAADVSHSGDISSISHEDIASFLVSPKARTRRDGGVKKAVSMNALRSSLKGFFQYLHKAGVITQDPTRLIRRAICGASLPRVLNDDEKNRFISALKGRVGFHAERDHVLFQLMLSTGIRLGSAIALNVEDLDLDHGELWLNHTKGNRQERAYLGKEMKERLKKFIGSRTSGPVFTNINGHRLSRRHIQRRFNRLKNEAGISRRASPHCLRHTYANNLYHKTGDLLLVKTALHHRSIQSTLVYAHPDESRLKQILSIN